MEIYLLGLAVLCDPLEEFEEVCPRQRCLLDWLFPGLACRGPGSSGLVATLLPARSCPPLILVPPGADFSLLLPLPALPLVG